MRVNFAKMQALGNDFVVVDLISQYLKLHMAHIKRIASRHFGIGCDQVLLIEPPLSEDSDFCFRIFNSNGQEAEFSGNGARCAARFFHNFGFTNRTHLKADCLAGKIELNISDNETITVGMGKPRFAPEEIPFIAPKQSMIYSLMVDNAPVEFAALSLGNPHAVIQVPNLETAPIKKLGNILSKHSHFPKGVNVGFMQIMDPHHIRLRVFERGAGQTLACGSGACAAAVAGIKQGLLESPVTVSFSKGKLKVTWDNPNGSIYLNGPASTVFIGEFRL